MKNYSLLLLFLVISLTVNAQNNYNPDKDFKRNEVSFSVGYASSLEFIDAISNCITAALLVGAHVDLNYTGTYSFEYTHRLNRLIGLGCLLSYQRSSGNIYDTALISTNPTGYETNNYFTIIPTIRFCWLRRKDFTLYSKGGIGITFHHGKNRYNDAQENVDNTIDEGLFNLQETAIGIEFGRTLSGFAELGSGQQGFFVAGIKYKF